MKRFVSILILVLAIASSATAQNSRSKFATDMYQAKHEMIIQECGLTMTQQKQFMPLYEQMEREIYQVNRNARALANEVEKKKLETIRRKYANKKNVVLCESLTSIEYWFLLHFENTNRFFKNPASTEKELCKYIPDYEKKSKFLQDSKWVSDLCSEGKLELAKDRAQSFGREGESYTDVYKAFELLDKLKRLAQR